MLHTPASLVTVLDNVGDDFQILMKFLEHVEHVGAVIPGNNSRGERVMYTDSWGDEIKVSRTRPVITTATRALNCREQAAAVSRYDTTDRRGKYVRSYAWSRRIWQSESLAIEEAQKMEDLLRLNVEQSENLGVVELASWIFENSLFENWIVRESLGYLDEFGHWKIHEFENSRVWRFRHVFSLRIGNLETRESGRCGILGVWESWRQLENVKNRIENPSYPRN